jgi:outer membrane protein TolC
MRMTTNARTKTEAITEICDALRQRVRNAERHYDFAQQNFPVGDITRGEAREVLMEAREAYRTVKDIAEAATA